MRNKMVSKKSIKATGYKAVLERLDTIENALPNGELLVIINKLDSLQEGQNRNRDAVKHLSAEFEKLKVNIYNPDSGVVVRANKNTAFRKEVEPAWGKVRQNIVSILE